MQMNTNMVATDHPLYGTKHISVCIIKLSSWLHHLNISLQTNHLPQLLPIVATIGNSRDYDFCLPLGDFLFEKKTWKSIKNNIIYISVLQCKLTANYWHYSRDFCWWTDFGKVMYRIGIRHSYLFDHLNVLERKNKLELQTNFDLW